MIQNGPRKSSPSMILYSVPMIPIYRTSVDIPQAHTTILCRAQLALEPIYSQPVAAVPHCKPKTHDIHTIGDKPCCTFKPIPKFNMFTMINRLNFAIG